MIALKAPRRRRHGVAAVEMAACLPLLLILMAGIWEVGQVVYVQDILDNCARDAARRAASGSFYCSNNNNTPSGGLLNLPSPSKGAANAPTGGYYEVEIAAITYLSNAGLNTTGAAVLVQNKTKGWVASYPSTPPSPYAFPTTGYDPGSSGSQLDDIFVVVALPYSSINLSTLQFFIPNNTNLFGTSEWYSGRNVPLAITTQMPSKPLP